MKNSMSHKNTFVIDYLNLIGLKQCRSINVFWQDLNRLHSSSTVNELKKYVDLRAHEDRDGINLYSIKNQNLKLSIDFSRYSTDLYRRYFDWFIENKEVFSPKRILEIGCDNGIVTCFFASLFPEAEVIGIDINPNGIKCAKELAAKLNLDNIEFKVVDINTINQHITKGSVDLLISVRSLHEMIEYRKPKQYWMLSEIVDYLKDKVCQKVICSLRDLINPEYGIYVSWERIGDVADLTYMIEEFKLAGLVFQWEQSDRISFYEVGDKQSMPILILKSGPNTHDTLKSIYEFHLQNVDLTPTVFTKYQDIEAEYIFNQVSDKILKRGLSLKFADGSGSMRFEIWMSNEMTLAYQYSNHGYRELSIVSSEYSDQLITGLNEVKEAYAGGTKSFFYETEMERLAGELNLD